MGLSDGRVLLKNVTDEKSDIFKLKSHIGKDRLPKHNRPCSSMQWSREYPNLLAVGFEKPDKSIRFFIFKEDNKKWGCLFSLLVKNIKVAQLRRK